METNDDVVQVPMRGENNVAKNAKSSKVSVTPMPIRQISIRTIDEVKNIKAFTTSEVDVLDHKSDSVQKGIQQREGKDEVDSNIIKNIRHIIQQKLDSINESDIKPVISHKIVDVNFSPAQNSKPTVKHIIDPSDDDSNIEIEKINIVTKTKVSQSIIFMKGCSAKQEEFIKNIMKQVFIHFYSIIGKL